jgi:hypothetical protein
VKRVAALPFVVGLLLAGVGVVSGMTSAAVPVAVGMLLEPGCGADSGAAAADAECSDAAESFGSQCTEVYTTLCEQGSRCGLSVDVPSCVTSNMVHCPCPNGQCDAGSCQAESEVQACQSDVEGEDCNDIVNDTIPSDCQPFTDQTM